MLRAKLQPAAASTDACRIPSTFGIKKHTSITCTLHDCTSAYVENEVGGVVGVSADLLEVVDGAVHEELERAHLLAEVDRCYVVLQRACAQHVLPNL